MNRGSTDRARRLVVTALFAAAITVMTAYVLHIPIPGGGYIHLGDMLIYLAACMLPRPYAIAAGIIGGGLADLLTFPVYVVPTIIMKTIVVLPFSTRGERFLTRRNGSAIFLAGILSPVGYGVAGCILYGSVAAFLPQFIGTLIQSVVNGIAFAVLSGALDRAKLKPRLSL
ncbi:MAG: TIGR04002 family protein [Oscillospiraceae bacterium]|nr:TIGR04002 family protein [Oscillospiraceae bacterium]